MLEEDRALERDTRPVAYGLGRLFGAGAGGRPARKGADGKSYVSFHFAVGQSSSKAGAVAHQRYLERAEDCVVSFGNIADTVDERARLWEAIGDRAVHRKGRIVIGADAPQALKEAVIARAGDWGEEGRIGLRHFVDLRQYWKWMRGRTSSCCTTAGVANPTSKRSLKRAAAVAGGPVERPLGKVPAGSTEAVASLWAELRRQNRHFSARDRHALLEYCRRWTEYQEARAETEKRGVMLLAEDGSPEKESRWAVRTRRLASRLDALRKELAMTPAARARAPTPGRPARRGEERLFDD